MIFENHEIELEAIRRLIDAGQYAEAGRRAQAKLAECRGAWGYIGKKRHEQDYISRYNRLRAGACRGRDGLPVLI